MPCSLFLPVRGSWVRETRHLLLPVLVGTETRRVSVTGKMGMIPGSGMPG